MKRSKEQNDANETDVLDWSRVGAARPLYNPCCQTYKEITYGHPKQPGG